MSARDTRSGESVGTERITAFSDGVFAIAITLLVLDLKLPDEPSHAPGDLTALLLELIPKFYSWVLSFVIIGIYWMGHHQMFSYIRRIDGTLLWLNILFLLCISFIPFPTSVLGEYGDRRPAVILYFGTLCATGLSGTLLWWYATRDRRLVDPDLDPQLVTYSTLRGVTAIGIFLLAIGVSFLSPEIAVYCPVLIPVAAWVLSRIYSPQEREAEAQEFGPP
jgi:uncharacterized membrane protein